MATIRHLEILVEYSRLPCFLFSLYLALNMEPIGDLGYGTRWAVLVAGSEGYPDYRHQADVCHAYQILSKGGLKDDNIILFMYDDIATHKKNPWPGRIYNDLEGDDVYAGVPKDYTGENATINNLFAVLLGFKNMVKGGSGKVVDSGPDDRIFFYYSDHGNQNRFWKYMPSNNAIRAEEFIEVLERKHAMGAYRSMLIYFEACKSGSIFQRLPEDLNILAVTASGADDFSYCAHCYEEFATCLGNIFSEAWMEYSETHNLEKVSVRQQIEQVKYRTPSNVMEFGSKEILRDKVSLYLGSQFETVSVYPRPVIFRAKPMSLDKKMDDLVELSYPITQKQVEIMLAWERYKKYSGQKSADALDKIRKILFERARADFQVDMIGVLLFGADASHSILYVDRGPSDDFECLKYMIQFFEKHCGKLLKYEVKHSLAFANICNRSVGREEFEKACLDTCGTENRDYSF